MVLFRGFRKKQNICKCFESIKQDLESLKFEVGKPVMERLHRWWWEYVAVEGWIFISLSDSMNKISLNLRDKRIHIDKSIREYS